MKATLLNYSSGHFFLPTRFSIKVDNEEMEEIIEKAISLVSCFICFDDYQVFLAMRGYHEDEIDEIEELFGGYEINESINGYFTAQKIIKGNVATFLLIEENHFFEPATVKEGLYVLKKVGSEVEVKLISYDDNIGREEDYYFRHIVEKIEGETLYYRISYGAEQKKKTFSFDNLSL